MKIKQALDFFKTNILDTPRQNSWFDDRRKYQLLFIAGVVFILGWQGLFLLNRGGISQTYIREGTAGFTKDYAQHFVYHFYYNDYFPLASKNDSTFGPEHFNEEAAKRQLEEHGDQLVMEWGHWSRLGENLRIYCYLPGTIIWGTAASPSIVPFNAAVFLFGLLLTWFIFWRYRRPWLGLLIIGLVGSSPFVVFEIYRHENIFGLLISNGLIQLALALPFFKGEFKWKYILIPLFAGFLIGSFVNIRGEILPILAAPLLIYWLNKEYKWMHRLALSAALLGTFYIVDKSWDAHFDAKWEEAYEVVEKHGGNPYTGPTTGGHMFWHPVFCGLGDYDTKYGYVWHDTIAYRYSTPILKEKYGLDVNWNGKYYIDDHYDEDRWYYKKFDEIPEHEQVMKDKVMSDIKADPGWYAGIIFQRIAGLFSLTSPVELNVMNYRIPIPWSGWFVLPVLLLLWRCRAWFQIKLLLFTVPLAASSVIIYGGGNSTYNSIYHFLTLALILSWLLEVGLRYFEKKKADKANTSGA